jgi:hypothetical protein
LCMLYHLIVLAEVDARWKAHRLGGCRAKQGGLSALEPPKPVSIHPWCISGVDSSRQGQ